MGIIHKATSISTLGSVHDRTPNQKTARYAKKSYQLEKEQARQASGRPGDADEAAAAIGSVMRGVEKMFRHRGPE
jgi:hypothetical protein